MRCGFGITLIGLLCALSVPLWAQSGIRTEGEMASARSVYEAEVTVTSQSDEARASAYARAMALVLGKLSGNNNIASQPGIAQELRNAKNYVQSFDYRQDQGTSASGAPSFQTTLVVRFRPEDIDNIVGVLGVPVWPQPRPKPTVWLAIDDGSGGGPRLVGAQQINAARPLLDRATERGFQLGIPAGNAAEQAVAGAIWRKDTAAVSRASARYDPPMQLLGKLYRRGNAWAADWVFIDNGRVLASVSVNDSDPRRAIAAGADVAADALIKRYARAEGAGPSGSYRLTFTGLNNADDYLRLSGALQRMSVVRRITPVRASGDRLELDLELLTGISGFNRLLTSSSAITVVEGTESEYRIR
ncbi:MAG: DUF2066 domain-containing protein [Xanthomonadaceae bacterium]|jgi:hypothetical protein|nr:DUF2066 domain-containing protein [Xanthomonadaceae bacterium]